MENTKPHFYQIVIDDYIAHHVRIPPLFMKHLSKDISKEETTEATIKCGANIWPIKLRKTSACTYIDDGWTKVMHDNDLGDKEFLVFRYDGNLCFNLQIFEKSGCQRIYSTFVSNKHNNLECFPKENVDDHGNTTVGNSENPHFNRFMKKSNVTKSYVFRLPTDFLTRLCATERMTTIELENSKGEVWKVNASLNTGSYCLCGGWHSFVVANNIVAGDECKFELRSTNRIRVHHFKVVRHGVDV
ncbi:hypothetical protein RND81_10G247700 [Saponaria officinalis]|uniref:TF-B3 domain-containing protein n=2 Tax=Saponaria officinalis TaxID=3572 RepID=A0AAW1I861_SAPOF